MISEVILRHRLADVIVCETIALFVEGGGQGFQGQTLGIQEKATNHTIPHTVNHILMVVTKQEKLTILNVLIYGDSKS